MDLDLSIVSFLFAASRSLILSSSTTFVCSRLLSSLSSLIISALAAFSSVFFNSKSNATLSVGGSDFFLRCFLIGFPSAEPDAKGGKFSVAVGLRFGE